MGETITLQRLLEMQKKVWNFKISADHETTELVAREQLKSFGQISRIGALIALPLTIYAMIMLFAHADLTFIVTASFYVAIVAFLSVRNFFRQLKLDPDTVDYKEAIKNIHIESIISSAGFSCVLAIPVAFGQIPYSLDIAILAMGGLVVGGFVFGSIPRAQTYNLSITTLCYVVAFLVAKGSGGISTAILLVFFALCIDYIYRLFFFNFVQRHMHAAKLKNSAETVRLLLNDYAEQSSDWLWEVDGEHLIVNPSARFATAVDMEIRDLRNLPLVDLFEESTERNLLAQCLSSGKTFRDIHVPIKIDGQECWWKLSGRHIKTATGESSHIRGVAADITSAKKAEERVAHLAHFDSLTDLPNRALFNQSLQRSIGRMKAGQKLAVLYLDLDHFKTINDTLGHGAGDIVLKAVASRLEKNIGIEDVVARLGGDEFAVSLRNVESDQDIRQTAQNLIDILSEPVMVEGQPVAIGVSIGIALAQEYGDDAEQLIKHADIALYHAKENGRGCASVFERYMHEAVQDRRNIEMDLRSALKRNELELYYQPLVNIETNESIGYEALLRWHHPEKGMIMPDVFIPVAEDTGLIVQLGEWVVRSALYEVAKWPEHLSVAVNLSPAQMRSPNLMPTIINALAATGVAPHRLELEITESVLMNDNQSNVELLHKIRSLGVRIALDDFGTGYSSLNYLRSFPFDKIKIDRCFVDEVDSREDCRAIIRAVTGLASSLGMVTTAEGVERSDQLSQLKEEGCVQVQGYLFSKAVPANNIKGRAEPTGNIEADVGEIGKKSAKVSRATPLRKGRRRKTG
ncbi:putative bifunctional diguanylate cyclase/phosphodiesterase [Parasphingorhabdus cellanae]|uniref:EAL domain-containing protein n=1 Tax=Parasphingorhabdus cellanae TaxID=2806553 RepID=A0ABX7T2E8_9SPHN|nr:EAL domain-containing protein [Parasphingorhabdus cellanae]QTD54980.1 EAL domain-containing protein [Parasphingorhabdus cellanae]